MIFPELTLKLWLGRGSLVIRPLLPEWRILQTTFA